MTLRVSPWLHLCQEPALTKEEQRARRELLAAYWECPGLGWFVRSRTSELLEAVPMMEPSWESLSAFADALRRLQRAQLAAWEEWGRQEIVL